MYFVKNFNSGSNKAMFTVVVAVEPETTKSNVVDTPDTQDAIKLDKLTLN